MATLRTELRINGPSYGCGQNLCGALFLKKRWRCLVDQLGVGWCDGLVSDFGALGGVMVVVVFSRGL